ncbi:endoribonuclease L-PSP [Megasphaera cerevisiae DSM 20462]|jgi:2-iminobutanoate/2-iminopropanoate deaminase|uniref:Endoribonuclease L-PSP n=1 Tax=Megasphaera cerevisiae DSM 20462 TaxID=1122219 RepID=A0A0J6ZRD3_9FIRM|nr:RidA family protein [Megasphaera cerevisiae]KMO87496.1 endoribonuclease L-PSP [Megasphaera cerevisiae DSM 20462]OKY54246.1 reactive intermediate/imine deaminase [Megasphaera cerevisiae]SJZ51544.1 endoribonuclease L-PSP [Megasphaera cerevisiae DSM 20462]
MSVTVIATEKAPGAVGPYSQAIKAGDFLFASGQIPINPEKGKITSGDVSGQAEQCMKNVGAILEAAGVSYDDVVKTTVYLTNINFFGAVNEVYAKYFQKNLPARSCVEISQLPKGAFVEVEVVAYCGK